MMNFFQPSVKLIRKERIGAQVRRVCDTPTTPLDRLLRAGHGEAARLAQFAALGERLDPLAPGDRIRKKIDHVRRVARRPPSAATTTASATATPVSRRRLITAHPLLHPPPQGGRKTKGTS